MVSFEVTAEESKIITKIAQRAVKDGKAAGVEVDFATMEMDLTACHANGCPLDLQKLLDAPYGTFGHDVYGIRKFIDRDTGTLTQCFLPRCSK